MKNDQVGERKRDPMHIYSSPIDPTVCPILSLAIYLSVFNVTGTKDSTLFPGTNQYKRFSKYLEKIYLKYEEEIMKDFGVNIEDIGVHLLRKGVASYVLLGSTCSPPQVATNIKAGWLMGIIQDTYLRYEAAGDQYTGRVVWAHHCHHQSLQSYHVKLIVVWMNVKRCYQLYSQQCLVTNIACVNSLLLTLEPQVTEASVPRRTPRISKATGILMHVMLLADMQKVIKAQHYFLFKMKTVINEEFNKRQVGHATFQVQKQVEHMLSDFQDKIIKKVDELGGDKDGLKGSSSSANR